MKGTTHLSIGIGVGMLAAVYRQPDFTDGTELVAAAAVSALVPDLDGRSILSRNVGKASRSLKKTILFTGLALSVVWSFLYFVYGWFSWPFTGVVLAALLSGLMAKEQFLHNVLLTLIGAGLAVWGGYRGNPALLGLGLFLAAAPWCKHRGMTHTIWAAGFWTAIAWGFEVQHGPSGLAVAAGLGYLSHLAADTLTRNGVRWLYPLFKGALRIPIIRK